MFSDAGQVVGVFLPTDRMTQRPRGFAFVEFSDAAAIPGAIEKLDGAELHGRSLRVSEARERVPRLPVFSDTGPPAFDRDRGRRAPKPKGSRRGIRGKKRGF